MKRRKAVESEGRSSGPLGFGLNRPKKARLVRIDDRQEKLIWIVTHRQAGAVQEHPTDLMHVVGSEPVKACGTLASLADFGLGTEVLYTATVVDECRDNCAQLFAAFLAVDEQDAANKLRARIGDRLARLAQLERGFDHSKPLVSSLVSDAAAHILSDVAFDPQSTLALGLNIFVEHRFKI